ncbi:hypothetical protein [Streptomyces sp. NPDC059979]|uniref:hypothetical protein n=1 Tax=Streptomyces sp. NPDC059979 TaxID=3347021 RepID=UPI0036A2266D
MADQGTVVPAASETSLVRDVFGALGGIVECGASLARVPVGEFVAGRRGDLDRVLEAVRGLGNFHPETMDILDGLGYLREHDVPVTTLLLWSGCIEEFTPALGEPEAVRRMARMGADLQLAQLLQALVGVASFRGSDDVVANAGHIAEVVGMVSSWGEPGRGRSPREVLLMWRVAFLPGVLMPESKSPEIIKRRFREYAHMLEKNLDQ